MTKDITEHYKKYGVKEGDKLLLETAKNNYQKGYENAISERANRILRNIFLTAGLICLVLFGVILWL